MSNFLETFYFLFPYLDENYEAWYGTEDSYGGWAIGILVLLLSTFAVSLIYYLIGRNSSSFSSTKGWFGFMAIAMGLVTIVSAFAINFNTFEGIDPIWNAQAGVWIFAFLNGTLYTALIYFLFSLVFRLFSKHARYVPF